MPLVNVDVYYFSCLYLSVINYYQINWLCFYIFAFLFLFKWLFKKFHWSFALAIAYTVLNTYCFGEWVELRDPYSYMFNLILREHHQEAFIIILLSIFLIKELKPRPVHLAYLCILNIAVTICLLPFRIAEFHMVGLSVNPAMNASITAITMPFLFFLSPAWVFPMLTIGGILVVCTGQFTPILALFVGFFGPAFIESDKKIRNMSIVIVTAILLFLLFHNKGHVTDRMVNWQLFGRYWWHNYSHLFGSGNGSFNLWGPWIQHLDVATEDIWFKNWLPKISPYWKDYSARAHWYWLWLHSDIYQTLFEMGIVGLLVWANCIIRALYKTRKNECLFSAMLAWLTVATFYYPLHFPVQMVLGLVLISFAVKK